MSKSQNFASVRKTSFECPHCNVFTTQTWYEGIGKKCVGTDNREGSGLPEIPDASTLIYWQNLLDKERDDEKIFNLKIQINWCRAVLDGKIFTEIEKDAFNKYYLMNNVFFSECYGCQNISIWHGENLIHPTSNFSIEPNKDLEPDIIELFKEAASIVELSPKGAAALLRLCLQLLCKQLGAEGKNIDKDIGFLVSKGLDPKIQKALDIVRVVGNESVHPGTINLNDNKDMARQLFVLINLICEQMITQPKLIEEMFNSLPKGKLEGIINRDSK